MKYVACLALVLLALGVPGVNFYHHVVLPEIYADKIEVSRTIDFTPPFVHTNKDITLGDEIYPYSMLYFNVVQALRDAHKGDTITLHLSGYGGDVQTTSLIINNMKTTKATVVTIAEASVYSGHAYLLLLGDKIIMRPYSYLMLHMSSVVNTDCSQVTGVDRGVPNTEHCQDFKDAALYQNIELLLSLKYLKPEEVLRLTQGHDLYIQADEMNKRIEQSSVKKPVGRAFFDSWFN